MFIFICPDKADAFNSGSFQEKDTKIFDNMLSSMCCPPIPTTVRRCLHGNCDFLLKESIQTKIFMEYNGKPA